MELRERDDELSKDFVEFGACPHGVYFLSLDVPGMGGRNSSGLCHVTHEGILRKANSLKESQRLVFGRAPPEDTTWEGVYADDRVCSQILPI